MSRENVELVERVYASFARGESAEWAFDPKVEWHHAGSEGIVSMIGQWEESFDALSVDSEPPIERGDHVIVPVVVRGRIRDTGNEIELPEVHVWTLRDGKVVEVREFRTKEEALAATPPPAGPPQ